MPNNSDGLVRERILETIKTHPEGLTIRDIASDLGMHRQTVTKYVLFLEGAGTIHRRRLGSATLHYLDSQYSSLQKKKNTNPVSKSSHPAEARERILETIKTHPEGLTIRDIASDLGMHRQTVTKYVLFLEGAGTIHRRRLGSATLHYMKASYDNLASPSRKTKGGERE